MKALTRVQVKRTKRVHPEWSDNHIFQHVCKLTDAAGMYRDTVTLDDAQEVIASMPEYRKDRLL